MIAESLFSIAVWMQATSIGLGVGLMCFGDGLGLVERVGVGLGEVVCAKAAPIKVVAKTTATSDILVNLFIIILI